jgi:hypothetical protein
LLNAADPYAGPIFQMASANALLEKGDWYRDAVTFEVLESQQTFLPGLNATEGDPTTENIAKWIHDHCLSELQLPVHSVEVWETAVNMAVYP